MGKPRDWTLFPQAVNVRAEDEEEAIAKAKTWIQQNINNLEFEDIVDEGEVEDTEINEEEIVNLEKDGGKVRSEDEDY